MADTLSAVVRKETGKNTVNKIRKENKVPGVVYKKNEKNVSISVDVVPFEKAYQDLGNTGLLELDIEGDKKTVIIKDVQYHPYKNIILHVDFQEVAMDEALRVFVPIVLEGRDEVILQPSVINQNLDEVEVECLPKDIPSSANVNVVNMEYNDTKFVSDLDIAQDEKITIINELDEVVCTLLEPKEEEDIDLEDIDMDKEPELIGAEDEDEEGEEE